MPINNISDLSELVETSLASYAFISDPTYRDDLLAAGFTATQVDDFVSNYEFVSQEPNQLSGFSATLFEDQSGKKVLAIRGTEFDSVTGAITDGVIADLLGIGIRGYANL